MRFIRVIGAALLLTAALAMPVLAGAAPAGSDVSVVKTDLARPCRARRSDHLHHHRPEPGPGDGGLRRRVLDVLPAGTTFVSFLVPAGWSGSFNPILPPTGQFFVPDTPSLTVAAGPQVMTLVVQVNPAATNGTIITNTADVAGEFFDPNEANNSATTSTTVGVPPPPPPPPPPTPAPTPGQPGGCRHAGPPGRWQPSGPPRLRGPARGGAERRGGPGRSAGPHLT